MRNMAFYSFPLRMLKLVRDAERAGRPVMPIEQAVWRLTGEIADWLGVDAGRLRSGDRADVVVSIPRRSTTRLDAYHEAPMEGCGLDAHGQPQRRRGARGADQRPRRLRRRRVRSPRSEDETASGSSCPPGRAGRGAERRRQAA